MNEIIVKAESRLYKINRMIYGHFLEFLGDCIKNGVWSYRNTAIPFEYGRIRKDVFKAIKNLKPPMIRFPGGCAADCYRWVYGIGLREKRVTTPNKAWGRTGPLFGKPLKNHFGTDEFLWLCNAVGAEPLINVNFGTADVQEAVDWVEYCNGSIDTKWGRLRAKFGHPEPYKVKKFGVGNESWGFYESGFCKTGKEYAEKYLTYAKPMKEVDPTIELLAVGHHKQEAWNKELLEIAGEYIDHLSVHQYYPGWTSFGLNQIWPTFYVERPFLNESLYYTVTGGSPAQLEEFLLDIERQVNKYKGKHDIKVALDEWNVWFSFFDISTTNYNLRDGIFTAGCCNVLQRTANFVEYANFAQLVNCLGLIIVPFFSDQIFVTPSYLAMQLYTILTRDWHVQADIKSEIFNIRKWGHVIARERIPYLDATASINEKGTKLTLFVVNRHMKNKVKTRIKIEGLQDMNSAKKFLIYHENPHARNSSKHPKKVQIKHTTFDPSNEFEFEFLPHSINAFVFKSK